MDELHGLDVATRHLADARLELAMLGLDNAAEQVATLIDDLDHGTTEEEDSDD
jgi:hypothetical protein